MSQKTDTDIIIVGGGHTGLTLALALKDTFRVKVIEPRPLLIASDKALSSGRSIAMLAGSASVMKALGTWRYIEPFGSPILSTEVHENHESISYDAQTLNDGPFGFGFLSLQLRAALETALIAGIGEHAFLTTCVKQLKSNISSVELELADGRSVTGSLVIGADGRNSTIRHLAHIGTDSQAYQQTALAFKLTHQLDHGNKVREFIRPQGPLAFLGLKEKTTGVTLVERPDEASRLTASPPETLERLLDRYLTGALGRIQIEGAIEQFPLGALHAHRYVARRVALVGDAAHGVHPIHAQGFNMGVHDIAVLCESLGSIKAQRDPGSADGLLRYERQRRPVNRSRLFMTDMLARVFSSDLVPVRGARQAVFRTLQQVTPLQRLVVRHGMQL